MNVTAWSAAEGLAANIKREGNTTGNVLSAMRLDRGTLKLIKWTIVD